MFTLKFTTGIRPTERNMQLARAAQIYYHKGAYAEKPEQKTDQKKSAEKPEDKKPVEQKADQKKPEDKKPVVEPVVEVLDKEGNIVAMLPGVPEEAPKAAKTASGFDINNFVKPKQSKQQTSTKEFRDTKNIDEVYGFMRSAGVPGPFDPMPGFSLNEKVSVLKKYANFNGTHPGLDVIQLNTLIMIFNSPDLARKMINCGLDPKQTLGVKRFNEVPANKYDNNNAYDFAFEYTLSKKKKLVLLVNSIPTYDEKQGWMSGYNISVR